MKSAGHFSTLIKASMESVPSLKIYFLILCLAADYKEKIIGEKLVTFYSRL